MLAEAGRASEAGDLRGAEILAAFGEGATHARLATRFGGSVSAMKTRVCRLRRRYGAPV